MKSCIAGLVLVAGLVAAVPVGPVRAADRPAGEPKIAWGLDLVLDHLAERRFTLPKGDYLLLSEQPMGIVSETIVYDFGAGTIDCIPGTHDDDAPIMRMPLSKEKAKLLRDVVELEGVRSLARESGKFGLDGSTFAAVIRIGRRDQRISQWGGDAPGLELLGAIRDYEIVTFEHERNRIESEKLRKQGESEKLRR